MKVLLPDRGSDPNLSNSLNPQLDVLVMLSGTAASLDEAAKLDQECLDAEKPVSINKTGCMMIRHPELLQGRQNLSTSTQSPPKITVYMFRYIFRLV